MNADVNGCYCIEMDDSLCAVCQERKQREGDRKVCESWNWNCSPRECAEDAAQRGWTANQIQRAMAEFGFKEASVKEVLHEFYIIAH